MFWFIIGVENIGWPPLLLPLPVLFELLGGGGCCGGSGCYYEAWLGYDEVGFDATVA